MVLGFAASILASEACRLENPAFRPLHLRDESSHGELTKDSGPASIPSGPSSDQHKSTAAGSSNRPSTSGSSGTLLLTDSEGPNASGTSSGAATSVTSSSMGATTGTGATQQYCKSEAAYCYLVDDRDSGNTILDARASRAPMTISKGSLGPTEPGVPNQAKVFTVSEDGVNAVSTLRWSPPLASGLAFDLYAKLPANRQAGSFIFGVHFRLILIINAQGSVICSFNKSAEEIDFTDTMALTTLDTGWHHYACEYDGQNVRLWVDGQPGPPVPSDRPNTTPPTVPAGEIGGNNDIQDRFRTMGHFRGSLSAIRIWTDLAAFNRAVSP